MLHFKTYLKAESTEWVTFIHGAGGSSSIWYKQIKAFKEKFNVLLVDLRGHGASKSVFNDAIKRYTFRQVTQDVVDVLDHLGIKKSHFVGISLGTIIIRELADFNPGRVQSMILGGAILKLNTKSQVLMRLGVWFKSIVPYILLYKLFAWIILPRKNHKESRLLFIREAKKLYQREFIRWFRLASEINNKLRLFRTIELPIPTLYIMGEQDHLFLPPVRAILGEHKFAELAVIPSCGHVVNVERPQMFNRTAISYLQTRQR